MASTEVIQKDVTPNPEVKDNTEISQKEIPVCEKNQELSATTPSGDAQQHVPTQQQLQQAAPQQQPQQNQQPVSRTRTSREEKLRKKDDKSVDHVLKALNSLNTTEEKLAAMCKKYADLFDENRKLQLALKQSDKRCSTLQREKEQLQTEHSKAVLTRSRLENLCRELQRQNKAIKDESLLKIREEEEKRKEVSAKFQATLNEITTLMQQNNDKNMKLRDDNIDMNAKLKNVCEQYELREQQVEKISKQMQLEAQLADAKLAKAKMEMAAEREIMLREKQQLLMELSQYQARCQEFQATEINLRSQISMYDDKYDEFQKALARSNEVFGGFKGEMEKMSKKMYKLEKEVSTWKQRWEGSHRALLEMAEEKQKADQELNQTNRQVTTLQSLCRTLQGERSALLAKLKGVSPSSDGKIDVNKIQESIENVNGVQVSNSNLQKSSNQQLLNGDIIDNARDKPVKNTSKDVEISDIDQNGIIQNLTDIEKGCVTNESPNSKELLPDSSNSSILVQNSCQPVLPDVSNSVFQSSEHDCSKEENLASISSNKSIAVNNNTTSLNNVIINDSSKPAGCATTETEGLGIVSDSVQTTSGENITSVGVSETVESINTTQQSTSTSIAVAKTDGATVITPDVEQSVANSTPIGNILDDKVNKNDSDKSIPAESNSSVEYTVTDVLKTTKVLPPASHDNKQSAEALSHDNINKENTLADLKQKPNEQFVKKQSNEHKKGKESKKKKKNT